MQEKLTKKQKDYINFEEDQDMILIGIFTFLFWLIGLILYLITKIILIGALTILFCIPMGALAGFFSSILIDVIKEKNK